MHYRAMGHSGVQVSVLCLGAMTFGEVDSDSMMYRVGCDEKTAHRILNSALDGGINFIDTADVYGPDGLSERIIGDWFQRDARRDQVVLATKCRFRMQDGPLGTGASRRRIQRACEDSLRRLRSDRIDLYQIHMQDVDTPEEEILRALDDLVRAGKVLYIGASNYAAYRLVESLWTSRVRNLEHFVTLQAKFNLVERDLEREHIPAARTNGLGILAWQPLASGFLTGKYERAQSPPSGARLERWKDAYQHLGTDRNWEILQRVKDIARDIGATVAQVSLAWVIQRPEVSSVIFGVRSVDQLDDNIKAAEFTLPGDALRALDSLSEPSFGYPYDLFRRVQGRW